MTRGHHDPVAERTPRLDSRVILWGYHADVVRSTAAVTGRSPSDIIRDLATSAIEANGKRLDTVRIRIETLVDADRTPIQIAEQLGLTVEYVRTVRRRIRRERERP